MPEIQTIASILASPQANNTFLTDEEKKRILAFQQLQKMAGATNMPIYSAGTGALKVATGALGGFLEGQTERSAAAAQAANTALINEWVKSQAGGASSSTFGGIDPTAAPPPLPPPPSSSVGGGPDIGPGGGISPPVDTPPPPVDIPAPPPPAMDVPGMGVPAISAPPVEMSSIPQIPGTEVAPPFQHVADAPRIVPIPSPPPVDGQPAPLLPNEISNLPTDPGLQPAPPISSVSPMAPAVMPGDMDRGMLFNPAAPIGLSEGATVLPNAAVKPVPIGPNGEVSNLAPSSPMANDPAPRPPADVPNAGDVGSLSAKYESGGNIASAHKDNIGWAYGKWQFNSKGNLPEFFARYPAFAKSFAGLTPGTEAFNERWKMIARNDPQGFEAAQREHATHELEKPGGPLEAATQLGFKTDNRGIYEAVWSGTQQHGGIKKVLAAAAQTPGFANMAPEDQVKAFYDARMHYVQGLAARGVPGLEGQPARYRDELKDATSLARSGSIDPNARAIPVASQQPASAPPAQAGPSPQRLAQALQSQPQAASPDRARALGMQLLTDPRTPPQIKSAIIQQLTPQKPIEYGGRLIDPRDGHVVRDLRDPEDLEAKRLDLQVKRQNLEGKPTFGVISKDQYGNEQYGWIDPKSRSTTPTATPAPQTDGVIPQPPPGVDPKVWRKEQSERFTRGQLPASFEDEGKLRGEVQQLPSYKNLSQAMPVYKSMVDAAGRNDRGSDVNLIYGFAKVMDPGSVVRESEMSVSQAIATLPQQLQQTIKSQLSGEGRLSPEVRQQIMREAQSRVESYKGMYENDAGMYGEVAKKYKADPDRVVPKFGDIPVFKPPEAPAAAAPGAAAAPITIPDGKIAFNEKTKQRLIRQNGKWVPLL